MALPEILTLFDGYGTAGAEIPALSDGDVTAGGGQQFEQFPKETVAILDSLYSRGMTGWGRSHTADVQVALKSTNLNIEQIRVCIHEQ